MLLHALFEAPDDSAMATGELNVRASSAFSSGKTTKLMTPADAMDALTAAKKVSTSYQSPAD